MANAPTATSSGSTAYSSLCRRIPQPLLSRCRPFRAAFRQGHRSTGLTANLYHPRLSQVSNLVLTRRTRQPNTLPRCIHPRGLTHLTTIRILAADEPGRQRRSTALDRLRQTIRLMTTPEGDLPFQSIATAPRPQFITRTSRVPMTGTRPPPRIRAHLVAPSHHRRRCETRKPAHRRRSSSNSNNSLSSHHRRKASQTQ
jgi:hypothetical protein